LEVTLGRTPNVGSTVAIRVSYRGMRFDITLVDGFCRELSLYNNLSLTKTLF